MKKVLSFLFVALMATTAAFADKTFILTGEQLTGTASTEEATYTYGDFNIVMSAGAKMISSKNSLKAFDTENGAILIGKKDAYIYNSTAFGKGIKSFNLYTNKGASKNVSVSVTFSSKPVTAAATGDNVFAAKLDVLDTVYNLTDYLPEGAKYFYYTVTNAYNSQVQFEVVYEEDANAVSAPVFVTEGTSFTGSMRVELSAAEGTAIYYTLDGTEPTAASTLYEAAISLTETTTIKAVAVRVADGAMSAVVSKTFTKMVKMTVAEVIAAESGTNVMFEGNVMAVANAGVVIADETGFIYLYKSNHGLNIGDQVRVSGAVSVYKDMNQMTSAAEVEILGTTSVTYPTAEEWTGASMEEWIAAPSRKYVTVEGTLAISGDYVNLTVEGVTESETVVNMASVLKPIEDITDLNGKIVIVTGYALYVTSSTKNNVTTNYAYIAATSIVEKDESTTGLNDITVDGKAHKVIENGVIYIYRNGVRYNALGSIAD